MTSHAVQTILDEYRRRAILEKGQAFLRVPISLRDGAPDKTHLRSLESLLETMTHHPVAIEVYPEFLEFRLLGAETGVALQALGAIAAKVVPYFAPFPEEDKE